ncbi:maltose ABC transporter substrate-binding protein [Paenibacillus selenitireducens]|uniref:Maltodextrin-binding protein n=1 Tax=Paenibacillus selenitireducens TaxID=1324314 RepID=A0A1T2X880_9BACL|nr:maltose ABC transporter substrate-binding protein [Paenibacillus selenitireducens]OPA76060.1 maltose ABC transporter substrate-binding protein [Paenibacillus selenitireducens]
MKKMLLLILTLTMVLALAACGGKSSETSTSTNPESKPTETATQGEGDAAAQDELTPEPGAKLVVWSSGTEKVLVDEAIKAFKEKYGIDVEFQEVGPDKSIERMTTDGPAGVGADVFLAVHDRIGSAVQAGIILPNDFHEEETKANNTPKAIDALTIDGILYGYPNSVETTAVFYNKDLVPQPLKTWDEVINFAKTFNDPGKQKYTYMWENGNGYWNFGFLGGYGAYVFGKDGSDPTDIGLNTDGAIESMKFFQSLKKDVLPLKTADVTSDIKKSLFTEGKLAMNVSGPWDTISLKEAVKNLGVMEYPTLPNGKQMQPFSGVKAFLVNANSKYPNAAKLFAHLITSEEFQIKDFELLGNLPSNTKAAENEKIKNDPFASVFLKQFGNSTPMPKIQEMNAFWGVHEATFTSIWNDGVDPKVALDDMVKKMKDSIASSK